MPDPTPELLDELERYLKPIEDDEDTCRRCHDLCSYAQNPEPPGLCHQCAQETLATELPTLLSTARLASARLAEIRRLREVLPKLRRNGHTDTCSCWMALAAHDAVSRCDCGTDETNALIDAALSGGEEMTR